MRSCKAYVGLLARMSLGRLLALMLATAAVETVIFWVSMERAFARGNTASPPSLTPPSLSSRS